MPVSKLEDVVPDHPLWSSIGEELYWNSEELYWTGKTILEVGKMVQMSARAQCMHVHRRPLEEWLQKFVGLLRLEHLSPPYLVGDVDMMESEKFAMETHLMEQRLRFLMDLWMVALHRS